MKPILIHCPSLLGPSSSHHLQLSVSMYVLPAPKESKVLDNRDHFFCIHEYGAQHIVVLNKHLLMGPGLIEDTHLRVAPTLRG